EIRMLFLNDAAVGAGCPNRRDDVLLVQFFLWVLWGEKPDKITVIGSGPEPPVNGVCGTETIRAIEAFQKWYWNLPPRTGFTDGRGDFLPVGRTLGLLRNLPYTIIGLNVNFGAVYGVDRHARIGKESSFPAELKRKLFV